MATEQFLTEKTPWRSFSTDKQYVSKKRPLNLHAFFPSTGQICDITLVKCVRKLLSLSCAYLCIIYIKRQKANFLSRKRLLHSENLVQPLFSVKTFSFSNSSAALVVYIINAALVCLKRIRIRFCFLLLT